MVRTRRWFRGAVLGSAVALGSVMCSSGVATAAPGGASELSLGDLTAALASFPAFAAIPDSRTLTAPVLLHGRLGELAGAPVGGAQVLLSAWPSNDHLTSLPIDGTFSTVPVARAVAGPDGTYELRSALTPLLSALLSEDGLDVQYDVFAAGRQYRYLSQIRPALSGGWVRQMVTDAVAKVAGVGATDANLLDVALDKRVSTGFHNPFGDGDEFNHPPDPYCQSDYQKVAEQPVPTTVATAVARTGATALVKYDHDAKTQTSLGVSVGGGLFKAGGNRTRTSHLYAEYPDLHAGPGQVVNEEYQVNVLQGTFRSNCARFYPYDGRFPDAWYVTGPERLTGGGRPVPSRFPLWDCHQNPGWIQPAGYKEGGTDNERAATYHGGFEFAPTKWGWFTGDSLSGYSSKVAVHFKFEDPAKGYWCGDHGFPLDDNQRVQGFQVQ